jgi:hypothetical protein
MMTILLNAVRLGAGALLMGDWKRSAVPHQTYTHPSLSWTKAAGVGKADLFRANDQMGRQFALPSG